MFCSPTFRFGTWSFFDESVDGGVQHHDGASYAEVDPLNERAMAASGFVKTSTNINVNVSGKKFGATVRSIGVITVACSVKALDHDHARQCDGLAATSKT